MGPRSLKRGNFFADGLIIKGRMLQWGHALSSVETGFNPLKRRPATKLQWGHALSSVETGGVLSGIAGLIGLQWGHALSSVETRLTINPCKWEGLASMGPRSLKRGNRRGFSAARLQLFASMGPRSLKRGNVGNGFHAQRAVVASMGPRSLKRGNLSASLETEVQFGGFNGATLSQAWKLDLFRKLACVFSRLQWGHALSSVETPRDSSSPAWLRTASMGPRSLKRGNVFWLLH